MALDNLANGLVAVEDNSIRFPARNYLLSSLEPGREGRYLTIADEATDIGEWSGLHDEYIRQYASSVLAPDSRLPRVFDPRAPHCPDPFRDATLTETNDGLHLIHVARARDYKLAEHLFPRAAAGKLKEQEKEEMNLALRKQTLDFGQLRPTWATFYEDVASLFDDDGWPDALRDALGLVHLDPEAREDLGEIVVFRYAVGDIPKLKVDSGPPRPALTTPTFLDGRINPAFCPFPSRTEPGRSVCLDEVESPCRELIHPTFAFRWEHVAYLGTLKTAPSGLTQARARHLHWIRGNHDATFGDRTDADILS